MGKCECETQFTPDLSLMDLWSSIYPGYVKCFGKEVTKIEEKKVKIDAILDRLKRGRVSNVWIESYLQGSLAESSFWLHVDKKRDILMMNHLERRARPLDWWDQWMELIPADTVIFSNCCSTDYLLSQISWSIERLEQLNVDHSGRPKVFDDDIKEEIVDVSQNPGLRIKRHRYFEQVGALMYIGPRFQERTGGCWEPLRKYSWCKISEVNGLIRLKSFESCFDSDQGEQAKRQRILREVLFPGANPVDPMGTDPSVPW
ncbi:hypothetical protein GC163_20380 [bacterium]|nr:hypothetical protein [bacterium]